jgi:hypothetical protein
MRVWLVAFLGAAACGLFPDTSSLSGGDAGAADATTDVGVADAEAGTSDAPSDAPSDALVSPCSAAHTFCDDFDQTALGATWDEKILLSGPLALTSAKVVSPPNALQATAAAKGGDETALGKAFPAANHTHVELDLLVASPANVTGTEVDVVDFVLDTPASGFAYGNFNLQRWQGITQLEEYMEPGDGGTSAGQDLQASETFSTWRHVALDLDFTNQTFAVAVDGMPVTSFAMNPPVAKTGFSMYVGVGYVGNANADWNVYVDNVVVDQQ